jgi:mRNA interferase RelE/StbE
VSQAKRILKFLLQRVAKLDDPRSIGEASHRTRFEDFWKYRVGGCRLICKIEDDRLIVLVLRVGHRKSLFISYDSATFEGDRTIDVIDLVPHA